MQGLARLEALGILPDCNHFNKHELFELEQAGDIIIHYLGLDGEPMSYTQRGKKKPYTRKRIAHPAKGAPKYLSDRGSGSKLYITPGIIEAYQDRRDISTLVVTEGEFKAYKGYLEGFDIVGIGGIHMIRQNKSEPVFQELDAIIRECSVKNIVLLFDADAKRVEYEEGKDLYDRPNAFFSAVRNFREGLKQHEGLDVYFGHLLENIPGVEGSPKGLDDLLLSEGIDAELVRHDLRLFHNAQRYFYLKNITAANLQAVKNYFGISNALQFYGQYSELLGDKPFIFRNGGYQFDLDKGELEQVRHESADDYMRVGDKYYKKVLIPMADSTVQNPVFQRRLVPFQKGEIKQDHGTKVLEQLPKFDAFCNVPAHGEGYQQVVHGCYNLYQKVEHDPQPGEWPVTAKYLKHLFQNEYQDKLDVMMDYLTLLYTRPTQMLPILALVSREKETGKTTFFWWLQEIFGENVTVVGNQELTDNFNEDIVSKLIIGLDEGLIDKKPVMEKIKSWSTAKRIKMEAKFSNRQDIDFFAKLIFTSNNETNFILIDEDERRFLVCKVPPIAEADRDPDLLDKMKLEVPHVIHHLLTREMNYKERTTRHWFPVEALETDALTQVKAGSRTNIELLMRGVIEEQMLEFGTREARLAANDFVRILQDKMGARTVDRRKVDWVLQSVWRIKPTANSRYNIYHWQLNVHGEPEVKAERRRGRYYAFSPNDWLTEEQIKELLNMEDPAPY